LAHNEIRGKGYQFADAVCPMDCPNRGRSAYRVQRMAGEDSHGNTRRNTSVVSKHSETCREMKPLILGVLLGLLLALLVTIASASEPPSGLNAGAWAAYQASSSSSAGAAVKTAQTAAQQVAVTINQPASAAASGSKTSTLRTVPDSYAPTVGATAPCRIAVSAGIAVIGIGVSGGGSVEDDPCNLRETARLLDGIGQREAAARVMCGDPRAARALGSTVCPQASVPPSRDAPATTETRSICDQAYRYEDPVLAARNGCDGW